MILSSFSTLPFTAIESAIIFFIFWLTNYTNLGTRNSRINRCECTTRMRANTLSSVKRHEFHKLHKLRRQIEGYDEKEISLARSTFTRIDCLRQSRERFESLGLGPCLLFGPDSYRDSLVLSCSLFLVPCAFYVVQLLIP